MGKKIARSMKVGIVTGTIRASLGKAVEEA
jgi:hypothetical protein